METVSRTISKSASNTILRGSKLVGDINVTCDLELSGEIEGNITSTQNSNIVIKGTCRGNIETRQGNVAIDGELLNGNITGSDVTISGKFSGGEIKAKGKIRIDGEFNGVLEGNEIIIGPDARGHGELMYTETISISRGANIEGQIRKVSAELVLVKNSPETKKSANKQPAQEMGGAK